MCNCCTPPPAPAHKDGTPTEVTAFESRDALLGAITPGMGVVTSDYQPWATVDEVERGCHDCSSTLRATVTASDQKVRIPAAALVDILDGTTVRVDRVMTTVNRQGWEL